MKKIVMITMMTVFRNPRVIVLVVICYGKSKLNYLYFKELVLDKQNLDILTWYVYVLIIFTFLFSLNRS